MRKIALDDFENVNKYDKTPLGNFHNSFIGWRPHVHRKRYFVYEYSSCRECHSFAAGSQTDQAVVCCCRSACRVLTEGTCRLKQTPQF